MMWCWKPGEHRIELTTARFAKGLSADGPVERVHSESPVPPQSDPTPIHNSSIPWKREFILQG